MWIQSSLFKPSYYWAAEKDKIPWVSKQKKYSLFKSQGLVYKHGRFSFGFQVFFRFVFSARAFSFFLFAVSFCFVLLFFFFFFFYSSCFRQNTYEIFHTTLWMHHGCLDYRTRACQAILCRKSASTSMSRSGVNVISHWKPPQAPTDPHNGWLPEGHLGPRCPRTGFHYGRSRTTAHSCWRSEDSHCAVLFQHNVPGLCFLLNSNALSS